MWNQKVKNRPLHWVVLCMIAVLLTAVFVCAPMAQAASVEDGKIALLYDDRKDLAELLGVSAVSSVEITDQVVTSRQVGTETADTSVLSYSGGTLYAVGTGTANLTVDGTTYAVTVSPAPLSMFMITGHSLGFGAEGSSAQSVLCEAGQVYGTFPSYALTGANGGLGYGSAVRASDTLDMYAPGGTGSIGETAALGWQWNRLTGEKIWVINVAIGGSCINEWQPGVKGHHATFAYPYDTAVKVFGYAQQVVTKEIAAGHYTLGHMGIIYHNGGNFENASYTDWTYESLKEDYETMWNSYKEDLRMDMTGDGVEETVEFLGLVSSWTSGGYTYDKAVGYYMAASAEYPDVFIASELAKEWTDESGVDTFPAIEYETQREPVYMPESLYHTNMGGTSDRSIYCAVDTHYSQVAYNAAGIDIADTLYARLKDEDTVPVDGWFEELGFTKVEEALTLGVGEQIVIVPKLSQSYTSGVTIEATGAVSMSFPMKIRTTAVGTGTVTMRLGDQVFSKIDITVTEGHAHCICGSYASGQSGHTCDEDVYWTAWGDQENEKTSLPTNDGNYYLVSDLQVTSHHVVQAGTEINICLNGYNIAYTGTIRLYDVKGTLGITDCSAQGGWGTVSTSSSTPYGAMFYTFNDDTRLNLYAGNYKATGTNCWGGILLTQAGQINIYNGSYYGSTVIRTYINASQGTRNGSGGIMYVMGGTVNVYDGYFTGGKSQSSGGNISVAAGTLNMYGGTVFGGIADGTLGTLTGAAVASGGNLAVVGGTANIMGGKFISGTSTYCGGNVALITGKLSITGGGIYGGTATYGGSVFIEKDKTASFGGTAYIRGADDDGNYPESGVNGQLGGIAYIRGILNMTGGTVTGGKASDRGNNFYIPSEGTLNLSGGTVSNGNIHACGTMTMSGGVIRDSQEGIRVAKANADAAAPQVQIRSNASFSGNTVDVYVDKSLDTDSAAATVAFANLNTNSIRVAASQVGSFGTSDATGEGVVVSAVETQEVLMTDGILSIIEYSAVPNVAVYCGGLLYGKYATFADAAAAAAKGGENCYVKLIRDISEETTYEGDVWVDMNGFDLSGVTVTGTLYGVDSTTDRYASTNAGKLTLKSGTVAVSSKTQKAQTGAIRRYLAVENNDGSYSFHRFYFGITHVVLEPNAGGIGYRATFGGSEVVRNYLDETSGFGLVASAEQTPEALEDGVCAGFGREEFAEEGSLVVKTVLIQNIVKDGLTDEELTQRGQTKICARSFLKTVKGDVILSTVADETLAEVMAAIDGAYPAYDSTIQTAVKAMYEKYENVMSQWPLPNLHHSGADFSAGTELDQSAMLTLLDANKQSDGSYALPAGAYYLTEDVDIDSRTICIASGTQVTLCLGGNTLSSNVRTLNVFGTLNLYDCCTNDAEGKQGTITSCATYFAPVFYLYNNAVFNLYSGNLTANTKELNLGGVGIISNDFGDETPGVMNMYGGRIYGGNSGAGSGGNLSVFNGGKFNMYGGEIYGGKAKWGAGICLNAGTVNLQGGKLYGNTATSHGGNLYVDNASAVVTVGPDMQIYGGSALNGGNMALASGSTTVTGATIADGIASNNGGNIYIANQGTYNFTDATLSGGNAGNDGGNLYFVRELDWYRVVETRPVVNFTGGSITGGKAGDRGAGVYLMGGDLKLKGLANITGNQGANLYLDAGQTVDLSALDANAQVGVSMNVPGTISADTASIGAVTSDDSAYTPELQDGTIRLTGGETLNVPELTGFSAGWHRGIITPTEPVPLDGMGNEAGRMENWGILTDLQISVTVIADETGLENAVVLCGLDILKIHQEMADNLAAAISDATGIPANRIFFSGSHTHCAPAVDSAIESAKSYVQWLYPTVTAYVVEAVEDLAPATLQIARTNLEGMNKSRRYVDADGNPYSTVDGNVPAGATVESIADNEMQIIRFVRYNETTQKDDIVLANWQAHVGHDTSFELGNVSAELWHDFRITVEEKLEHTVCGFFLGGSGNVTVVSSDAHTAADGNTYDTRIRSQFGAAAASYAIEALKTATDVVSGPIRVKNYTFETEGLFREEFLSESHVDMHLNAISIGDVAFVTAPYEMFHENGKQIKDFALENDLFEMVFVCTNSNGENKYIASEQAFVGDETDGQITSFEVRICRFVKGTAEQLVAVYQQLLEQINQ